MDDSIGDPEGEHRIVSETVRAFCNYYKGPRIANHMRTRRLWKDRTSLFESEKTVSGQVGQTSVTRVTDVGRQRYQMKARPGRGRKRKTWVEAFREDLREEFDRLRRLGVKFSISTLLVLSMHVLRNGFRDAYSRNMIDPRTGQTAVPQNS